MTTKLSTTALNLIDVAGPLFASKSFEAVSTREIADKANANLSAISYHFGNKDGLYKAVFQKIVDDLAFVRGSLKIFIDENCEKATEDPGHLRLTVKNIVSFFISAITDENNPKWRMRLVMREVQEKGPCFDLVLNQHINIVHDLIGRLVRVAIGPHASEAEVGLKTHSLVGLCLQFGLNEAFVCQRFGWEKFGPDEVEVLIEETVKSAWALLGIPAVEGDVNE
ncbi:CerR family C-terminal domain-containing protein [Sneathiella sp. P13V-1]|uniref:CerR family C-terminal domain-containing protein n=1 Tax=Sneathiella sp. P13V-1 TaxID=2697366 RepID=UPI00187B5284|nr:CerR family C-terminal domain-containing protein [Sneathiella sp. P13V-1]MBE7635619.1 CerR family C-terminal domain-containing protein [Sneathiella sp. P13V-1]